MVLRIDAKLLCLTLTTWLYTAGCATTEGAGSETHLVRCSSDAECVDAAPGERCQGGKCVALASGGAGAQPATGGAGGNGMSGGAGGGGPTTWLGAPCDKCDLHTQIAPLTSPTSEDCGQIRLDAGSTVGADCAHAALNAGRPFTLIVDDVGTDSTLSTAWIFKSGLLYVVAYDSNVCGGGPSCDHGGCGPHIVSSTCAGPTVSTVPNAVFDCASRTDTQTLCGPVP
jgi:hypothetical protein